MIGPGSHSLVLEPCLQSPEAALGLPRHPGPLSEPKPHTDLLGQCQALWVGDRRQFLLLQLLDGVLVVPQVQLGAHQDDGCAGAVVPNLGKPLDRRGDERGTREWGEKRGATS